MISVGIQLVWLMLYWYYTEQNGSIKKGFGRRAVTAFITLSGLLVSGIKPLWAAGWLFVAGVLLLFDLFFDEIEIRRQWWRVLLPGILLAGASSVPKEWFVPANGMVLFFFFALLAAKRGYLSWKNGCTVAAIYGVFVGFSVLVCGGNISVAEPALGSASANPAQTAFLWGIVLLEVLIFFMAESTLFSYKKGFEHQSMVFEQEILGHQYEEIKSIYMDMRGWRHDYHNHLQVMKAQLALGSIDEITRYLDELEQDLDRVDTYVKSGNLMVDAILNSKLSLAEKKQIAVKCKAEIPEVISVEDVDICVILGNLLDNAIEACEKIPAENRFLRVYMVVNKSQLYISVQNSAKEELDFNERHYITNKRGSHGFGMRRVKALVDKYEGFLNLANEPGIFAAEVTMPLDIS